MLTRTKNQVSGNTKREELEKIDMILTHVRRDLLIDDHRELFISCEKSYAIFEKNTEHVLNSLEN